MKIMPVFFILFIVLGLGFFFLSNGKEYSGNRTENIAPTSSEVDWSFDFKDKVWKSSKNPPSCPEPLVFTSPVNLSLVSGILYPGQIRGGDYKPHGGFRFDGQKTNDIEVAAIMDGYLLKASRYLQNGEEQILLFYVNECGIMIMHDHLFTLSPKLQKALSKVPLGREGDSRTTIIEPKVKIKKGEVLATEVGFKENKNIFVDFGLYDLKKTNEIVYDSHFLESFPFVNEYGFYALCWFDYLLPNDKSFVRSLPAGGVEGKTSDYCN